MKHTAKFWLGTHKTGWLARTDVPLMVSRRRLEERVELPRAKGPWVLDSAAFTELSMRGQWTMGAGQYACLVMRFAREIGGLQWAACQDWMCEPAILAKTGLDVVAHQVKTVTNYLTLRQIAPELPIAPVLQGWHPDDYLRCADLYEAEGVDLASLPVVGLGSVCRRQATAEIEVIVRSLAARRYRLHGFGMKVLGLARCADALASADSLAWSYEARRTAPMGGHLHKSCANCLPYALAWRERLLATVERGLRRPHQFPLVAA